MKKILLVLLMLPTICNAQNWKGVSMNDTVYYTIPEADDYLRVIWVDSFATSGSDSIFYFYPSIRLGNTTTNCLDTLGPTWLGKKYIRRNNGEEIYFNRWLDTITLKTQATINTSWILYSDTNGYEYRATLTSADTMTIDNQLDSIKEITIQVFTNNQIDSTHFHHNQKIVLSKNHGFVNCLEWYGFPSFFSSHEAYPYHPYIHKRFNHFSYLLNDSTNHTWKYRAGNTWQFEKTRKRNIFPSFWQDMHTIIQDSIIGTQVILPDSLIVISQRKKRILFQKQGHQDSISVLSYVDTFSTTIRNTKRSIILPEYKSVLTSYFCTTECNRPMLKVITNGCRYIDTSNNCYKILPPVSPCAVITTAEWFGFGDVEFSVHFPGTGVSSYPPYDTKLTYAKVGNCEFGSKYPIWPLSSKDVSTEPIMSIFPNPVKDEIFIKFSDKTKIINLSMYSIYNQAIITCRNCSRVNTKKIPNGIYILNITTNRGAIKEKILVQH